MPPDSWPNYVLNNHDNKRSATRFKAPEDDERLKVAAGMILTLRGTPFLYAGEEIGMRDIKLKRSEIQDPVGKHYWPINVGRDGCRSPMQWNADANAGFTRGKPWLKIHPNYLRRNVDAQLKEPRSLLNFYRKLLKLRRDTPALHRGSFMALNFDPRRVLGYLRQYENQTVLVALNFGKRKVRLALGDTLRHAQWELLLSNKRETAPKVSNGWLALEGDEVCILLQK
jgi:alpha-glucosidase